MKLGKFIFGIIDLVIAIVVLVIGIVFSYVCFFDSIKASFVKNEQFDVTFYVSEINSRHSQHISNGELVAFDYNTEFLGKIKSVKLSKASYEYTNKANNTSETYKLPDKDSATILIEFQGREQDGALIVNGKSLFIGDSVVINTPNISFEATVIKINKGK